LGDAKPPPLSEKPIVKTTELTAARSVTRAPVGMMWLLILLLPTALVFGQGQSQEQIREQPATAHPVAVEPAHESQRLEPATLDALRAIPVLHDGRVKPLDTVARQTIRQITGRTQFGYVSEVDGELKVVVKLNPVELLFAMMSDPEQWAQRPVIQVELLELRGWLGMPETHAYISAVALMKHEKFHAAAQELFRRSAEAEQQGTRLVPTRFEDAVLDVSRREGHFRAACTGAFVGFLPYPDDQAFFDWLDQQAVVDHPTAVAQAALPFWQQLSKDFSDTDRHQAFLQRAGWLPLNVLWQTDPSELPPSVTKPWIQAGRLWGQALNQYGHGEDANPVVLELSGFMPRLSAADVSVEQISREVFYNRVHPFRWAMMVFLLAVILFAFAWQLSTQPWLYRISVGVFLTAIAVHMYGFYLRVRISGWAPVTNMYETIIWVALFCAIFGMVLELVYRWRVIGLTAALVASICGLIADIIPPNLGADFHNLQPVLRSNFWLSTHVTTIVSSYAAFALALGLGNIALGFYIFSPGKKEALRQLNLFIYRAIQVGVLLVAAGTILGGVWADQSWGRFWGWDPKEVWALIVLLVYLALLHSRYTGWVGPFGLAAGAVLGFQAVIMAWYGVNFVLGVGLHSYGFGTGGRWQVFTYMLLQSLLVVAAWWRRRQTTAITHPVTVQGQPGSQV
jgi:cytochrome c-type biogenesis protein CcsB